MHSKTEDRGPLRDHRQEVTDKVIALMESGTAPWCGLDSDSKSASARSE